MERGQVWRLLTAHLVHPSARLAAVDLLGLLAGGVLLESRSRARLALLLLGAALVVGVAIQLDTRVQSYSGASGLTAALLAAAALRAVLDWRGWPRALAASVLLLVLAKLGADAAGVSWWGGAPGPGLRVSTLAHIAGAATGLLAGSSFRRGALTT
ncbi:MAG TPA: rhomboid family intramembrane serine protease [Planctomycetota bacterium]|nr:rhomboid family intramembrane serine protease [Planctomycetota bacterium]